MKNEMKLNNKGFSLVELIVVIAIMAILVGVLAPSVLGQLDKAKISKDKQTIETVCTAVATAYADQMVTTGKPSDGSTVTVVGFATTAVAYTPTGTSAATSFANAVYEIVGYTTVALESSEYKGKSVEVKIANGGKVTATVVGKSGQTFTVTR